MEKLSESAENLLQLIDEAVISDYDKFVNTADSYHSDADKMEFILHEFHSLAANLADVLRQMTEGTDEINISVEEIARAVALAANSTEKIVDAMVSIKERVDKNYEISQDLSGEVSKFNDL